MKKKLISGGLLIALGIIVYSTITIFNNKEHTSSSNAYYDTDETSNNEDVDILSSYNITEPEDIEKILHSIEIDTNPNSITVFVNKEYGLPENYVPSDLVVPDVAFYFSYFDEKKMLRSEAASALEKLFQAALEDENCLQLYGVSGYRSYERQKYIYNNNVKTKGLAHANRYSAKPGYSEHQTGLSIDVSCASIGYGLEETFGNTPEGKWLAENCYKFGFIIRYPKGKESITGYAYEPWHIRYVGVTLATYLTEHDMTLEEFYDYTPSEEYSFSDSSDSTVDMDMEVEPNSNNSSVTQPPQKVPSTSATASPTAKPTTTPTASPTTTPTVTPTTKPTTKPIATPNVTPTTKPTATPNVTPTTKPTTKPTATPNVTPTAKPTATPSTPTPTKVPEESSDFSDNSITN